MQTKENWYGNDSPAWRFQVVLAFAVALVFMSAGIFYLPADAWVRGYLVIGLYFTVSAAFNLAKTLRDDHENEKLTARIAQAKTEKILREYGEVVS